jgi:hypothetical protein
MIERDPLLSYVEQSGSDGITLVNIGLSGVHDLLKMILYHGCMRTEEFFEMPEERREE